MSHAGAFSSAACTFGEERVESSGEFSLVSVWSKSDRPLFVEGTDPIKKPSLYKIGTDRECFSAFPTPKVLCLHAPILGCSGGLHCVQYKKRGALPAAPESTVSERTRNMMLGMSLATFTLVHVLISLMGIVSGFVIVFGLLGGKRLDGWTAVFLTTTALTSLSGFGFPFEHLLPSHKVGIVSLVVLAVAIAARYAFHLAGAWRSIYSA